MKNYFVFLFCSFSFLFTQAQDIHGCDGSRYINEVFEDTIPHIAIKYGENYDVDGNLQELFMDIYEPANDTEAELRPVLIWVFGGAFIGGQREDMTANCISSAKKGFVSATIDYRLLNVDIFNPPDSIESFDIATKAMGDLKGAIRYLRSTVDVGNPYKIDTDLFFLGGLSAGGITALQAAIVDEEDDVFTAFVQTALDNNGGLEGNTGDANNMTYSSDVSAVVSLSGAVYDTSWIDVNDPPIYSIHGKMDETVYFGYDWATVFTFEIIPLHGSGNIHARADNIGMENYLLALDDGDHYNIYTEDAYADTLSFFDVQTSIFFHSIICPGFQVSNEDLEQNEISSLSFPNPASNVLNVEIKEAGANVNIELLNAMGQRVTPVLRSNGSSLVQIPVQDLTSGTYLLRITDVEAPARNSSSLIIVR